MEEKWRPTNRVKLTNEQILALPLLKRSKYMAVCSLSVHYNLGSRCRCEALYATTTCRLLYFCYIGPRHTARHCRLIMTGRVTMSVVISATDSFADDNVGRQGGPTADISQK